MNKLSFFKKVWRVARKYKNRFVLSYLILLFELIFTQIMPLLLGNVIDAAVYKTNMTLFTTNALVYAMAFLGQQLCGYLQLHYWQILNNKYVYELRVMCYKKVLSLRAKILTNLKTGDVLQTINTDTMEFHHVLQRYLMRIVNSGIGVVISIAIVICLKWEIAVLIGILIPCSVLITNKVKRKIKKNAKESREKQGDYNAWLMEVYKGFREIKLLSAEKYTEQQFFDKNSQLLEVNIKKEKLNFKADQIIGAINMAAQLVFYCVSAYFVFDGQINVAQYISIASYYALIVNNFRYILHDNMTFQNRKISVERVLALLEDEFENEAELHDLRVSKGEITISNLTFAYQNNITILDNISLQVAAGRRIGLVGQSGAGKSTFAHLMVKFYPLKGGAILIDGEDISKCTYSSIRQNIGIVCQDTIMFNATIKDNICFGENVPDEKIWDIIDKVFLKADIEKLPSGIHTLLGENGINLSGGQSQRLAIARILYKNPPIVILDEATSALDEKSELIVQKALDALTENRTSIIISHRLNSIKGADEIFVLRNGSVANRGAFCNLIENDETFRELFLEQAKRSGIYEE